MNDQPTPEPSNYAAEVECAIGLNVGNGGGIEGVHAARDAVLAVRDREMERLSEQANAFRQTAIRRAILLSRHQGLLVAIREFVAEETTPTNGWGDGYRDAKRDLAEILDAFAPDAVDQAQPAEDAEAPNP